MQYRGFLARLEDDIVRGYMVEIGTIVGKHFHGLEQGG